jgi:hypothetical protein
MRKQNLIEEIYRMRKLMNFDSKEFNENTTSFERLIEEGIRKNFLKEQDSSVEVDQTGLGKKQDNPDRLFDEEYYKPSTGIQKKIKGLNPNFDSQLSELQSNPAYEHLLTRLDNKEKKVFYELLTQKSRLIFLNTTLEFMRSFTKKKKLEKELEKNPNYSGIEAFQTRKKLNGFEVSIDKGKTNTETIPVEKNEEIEFKTYEIPLYVQGKTVYKDNSTEPAQSLIQEIDTWVGDVKKAIEKSKEVNPNVKAECVSIDVISSCSRLRNTGDWEGKTWNELSKGRSDVVYNILKNKLVEVGVDISPNIEKILRGGENGDGSSGPDPAKKFLFDSGKKTSGMSYSTTGADTKYGPNSERFVGEYGKLLDTQEESHQYKYCAANAVIIMKLDVKEDEPLQPEVIYDTGFSLVLKPKYYSKPIKLKGGYKQKGGNKRTTTHKRKWSLFKKQKAKCAAYGG